MAGQVSEAIVNWMPAAGSTYRLYALEDEIKARGARMKLAELLSVNNRFVRYYAAQELCRTHTPTMSGRLSKKIRASSMLSLAMRAGFCGRSTTVLTNRNDVAYSADGEFQFLGHHVAGDAGRVAGERGGGLETLLQVKAPRAWISSVFSIMREQPCRRASSSAMAISRLPRPIRGAGSRAGTRARSGELTEITAAVGCLPTMAPLSGSVTKIARSACTPS